MNPQLMSEAERLAAIERLMEGDDDEFDYERYKEHPIADEDWRTIPLFMDAALASGGGGDNELTASSVALDALAHMDADFDPEPEADDFKRQASAAFARGLEFHVAALKMLTKAIRLPVKNYAKRSVYFSNRAAVNLAAENYGNCVRDCQHAIRLDPSNVKAYYRAAKASYALRKAAQAAEFCALGLTKDADNAALRAIKAQADAAVERQQRKEAERRAAAERKAAADAKRSAALFALLADNGARLGAARHANLPLAVAFRVDDETGALSCRVQFLYEEHAQSDTVESMLVSTPFRAQLDGMFPPGAPAPGWDAGARYALPTIELYVIIHQTQALTFHEKARKPVAQPAEGKPKWHRVPLDASLGDLLRTPGYVVPGLVQVHVVVRDSEHAKSMLAMDPFDFA